MKTIRISRQGFPSHGMHSWMRFIIWILSKKYNVIIDDKNPDIVVWTNFYQNPNEYDTFLKCVPKIHERENPNIKFLFLSGEIADFYSVVNSAPNQWSMGYQSFGHPNYFRMPSYVMDIWTMFDEARITDSPFDWLTKSPPKYDAVKNQFTGFCSVVQASTNDFREKLFNVLSTYKQISSTGPWRPTVPGLDKHIWMKPEYIGRNDGLTYRQKIEFFKTCKFNISVQYLNTEYVVQEKLIHAIAANSIPLFYGNSRIEEEGFNPERFINLHKYSDLNECLQLIKEIDTSEALHRKYLESPIFVDNRLPEYFDMDRVMTFFESMVEK